MAEILGNNPLSGTVSAPCSKSVAHREYICAALSDGGTEIVCPDKCDDVMLTIRALSALGAGFDGDRVTPIRRDALPSCPILDCGESGSTLRFLMPIIAALGCGAEFKMSGALSRRPIEPLKEVLREHGAVFEGNKLLPGRLTGSEFAIRGDVSSQFISGLLMALPIVGGGLVNITTELKSSKYVDITIDTLQGYGIYVNRVESRIEVQGTYRTPRKRQVEGDWSAAAFWLCAGAVGNGAITVTGLDPSSKQGDKAVLDILRRFGAEVLTDGGSVTVRGGRLHGIDIDASDIPDLIPPLSVVCAAAEGESRMHNAGRLREKESDRLSAIYIMLTSMGADVRKTEDGLIVHGGRPLHGASVQSFHDHRIAMSAAIAAQLCGGSVCMDDTDCVSKSYPGFFRDYSALGGVILE